MPAPGTAAPQGSTVRARWAYFPAGTARRQAPAHPAHGHKRNPCFNLYLTEDGRSIHVYYGLERLEVVPAAGNHPAYRMLVARLYNADVKVSALAEVFDLDHKTIRAWGLALDSGDPEALQRMLFGAALEFPTTRRARHAGR